MREERRAQLEKLLEEAMHEALFEHMREISWRRRGRRYYYDSTPPTKICAADAEPDGYDYQVSLRFGVWFPEVARLAEAVHDRGLPEVEECTVQTGLDELCARGESAWWPLKSSRTIPELAQHLSWGWRTYGIPWIEEHSDPERALATLLARGDRFPAAAMALYLGRREEASRLLTEEIFERPLAAAGLKDWGRNRGLL